ncbi:MAG: hypothetical protein EWV60_01545 [Microcystis sp. Msp_OC_L_20101000_S702]|nr:MAG: hypothetical protein EWV60_01545 [Microcystis sp. Msp_OC_L_20101000_S702]
MLQFIVFKSSEKFLCLLIKGGLRGDPPAYRHPPYQGGQGGSNLKSIFNLIITSYLFSKKVIRSWVRLIPS